MNFASSHPESATAPGMLERDAELARVESLLAAARAAEGGLLAVEGVAGIGKTTVLEAAQAAARASGMTVLAASGSELERDFGFGIARRLFEPVLVTAGPERRAALLDGAAGLAVPALGLGVGAHAGGDPDTVPYAAVHGLYWLTANLASESPLLLVVDDLQWADAPSQRFLAYLGRRLAGLAVAVLVALRPAVPGEERTLVEAIVGEASAGALQPAPLSEAAIGALTEAVLAATPDPVFTRACHRATQGNALLAREVLADMRDRATPADAAAARDVGRIGPERVARSVLRRIDALGADAQALAGAVAVLGDGSAPDVAAALAGLHPPDAVRAAAALAASDVLADGLPLRFRHPVVRAAVADRPPAVQRAAAHADAARLLAAREAAPAVVATHLLHAAPAADA